MVDLERLRNRGLSAYERGRLRMALRALVFLAPAFAACWLVGERELCACLMPLLAGGVVWLRWRDRRGLEDATIGLLAGSVPLIAGLMLSSFGTRCGGPMCVVFSAVAGVAAGIWVALERRRRPSSSLSSSLVATSIAATSAVLGCSALGVLGIAGVVAGVVAGSIGAGFATRPGATE